MNNQFTPCDKCGQPAPVQATQEGGPLGWTRYSYVCTCGHNEADISYSPKTELSAPTPKITDVTPINDYTELVTHDDGSIALRPAQENRDEIELSAPDGRHLMKMLQGIYGLEPIDKPKKAIIRLSGWCRLIVLQDGTFVLREGANRSILDNYTATRLMYALLAELQSTEDKAS